LPIISLNKIDFFNNFKKSSNVFLSKEHLDLHIEENQDCIYLVNSNNSLGIFLRIFQEEAQNPYAAPFGGVVSKDNRTEWSKVNEFILDLISYLAGVGIKKLYLCLPAPLYGSNSSTKIINSLILGKFIIKLTPEINSHILLNNYDTASYSKNIKEIIRKTLRHKLSINEVYDEDEKLTAYNIVKENRINKSRTMSISYNHLRSLDTLCCTRYFIIKNSKSEPVASAITFKSAENIIYAQFWGDNLIGRELNAMDFLCVSMVQLFKKEGWWIFDLGISSENGIPNSGLLRFKESHLFDSTLRFSIDISIDQ
jgi:hypothetical protein